MKLGYNTNGTAFHRWQDAIELMAEIGYRSVAITVDHYCLNPFSSRLDAEIDEMRELLARHEMVSVIETGARYLLDPRHKHEPTLLSATAEDRQTRRDFLKRCVDLAAELRSEAVSFWSGVSRMDLSYERTLKLLAEQCRQIADYADAKSVRLAFEPEPGMFVQRLDQFERLTQLVNADHFGLTVDVGHVHCVETVGAIGDHVRCWGDRIFNVHIEDMKRGVHEHLRFGEGEIDFAAVLAALQQTGYSGALNVELSRHSHIAPEVMRESFEFLQEFFGQPKR